MGRNLIFLGELECIGFMGALGDKVLKMFNGALRAFKVTRNNGIYIMHAKVMGDLNFATNINHI